MQLSDQRAATAAVFDDPNLVSFAGLVPVLAVADSVGLRALVDEHLSVPTDRGANAGLKVASLVAGMVAGADSIDDMGLLRHGGMGRLFTNAYAPSTLGSFLPAFAFGHVRQLDSGGWVLVDVDGHDHRSPRLRQGGPGFGYSGVRGLKPSSPRPAPPGRPRWSWRNGCARDRAAPRAGRGVA